MSLGSSGGGVGVQLSRSPGSGPLAPLIPPFTARLASPQGSAQCGSSSRAARRREDRLNSAPSGHPSLCCVPAIRSESRVQPTLEGRGGTSVTPRRRAPLEPPWECVKQIEGPSWYLGLKATPPFWVESQGRVASCERAPSALWTKTAPTRHPRGGAPGHVTPGSGGQLRAPVWFPAAAGQSTMSVCSWEFVYGETFAK